MVEATRSKELQEAPADQTGASDLREDKRPLDIVMYTEGLPFDGETINHKGLGGSETAAYYICRELAVLGNKVRLFCNTARPGTYDGVDYAPAENFGAFLDSKPEMDALICSRHMQHFLHPNADSRANVIWNHDIVFPQTAQLYGAVLWKIDSLFFNSEFHKKQCDDQIGGLPEDIYYVSRNGVDLDLVRESIAGVERQPFKMIYTSRPDRGLDVLLAMWPGLKERIPELELYITYYEFPAADQGSLATLVGQINKRIEQLPGVHKLPAMPKADLYRHIASARLLLYTSIFWETSCISAIEAMACGTPVITTSYCALKETVQHQQSGILVKGAPRVEKGDGSYWYVAPHTHYQDRYVDWVERIVRRPAEWQKLHNGALRRAQHYDYKLIAKEWEAKLRELIDTQNHQQTCSACMIVKDGEDTLHRCLKTIRDEADEIIVLLDDSTSDSSETIARQYTDKVYPFTWPESFGEARNLSIQRATGDWVLWIDADEHLHGSIRRYLRHNCFNSYAVPQIHIGAGVKEHADYPARLFRNRMGVQFYGRVHEQPEREFNKGVPKTFLLPDVRVVHDGYSLQGAVDKRWERNHEYMAQDLEENPERHISWFSYMRDCVSGSERMLAARGHANRLTPADMDVVELLQQAIHIWNQRFSNVAHPWHAPAYPLYQTALRLLGYPEFAFALAGSMGRLPEDKLPAPERRFFQNDAEMRTFLNDSLTNLFRTLRPQTHYPFEDD